ncbi:hypothetical protein D3C84_645990 [compost metagenome]
MVVLGELPQARVFVRAVRVLAFRVLFLGVVLGHPQLLVHETQAVVEPFVLAEVGALGHRVGAAGVRNQLIGNRVADLVLLAEVGQQAHGRRVELLRRLLLVSDHFGLGLHGAGARAATVVRQHHRVHFHQ